MDDRHRVIPSCVVSLAGQRLGGALGAALTRVQVDLDVDLFGQCVLVFNDPDLQLAEGRDFLPGTRVEVEAGYGGQRAALFSGEVVALEPQLRRDLPIHLRVVCQELLHRLALAAMTRSFQNVDDAEVVKQIALANGLSGEGPGGTREHLLQPGLSDAVFLRRLAQRSGHHLRIEGTRLVMGEPPRGEELRVGPADGLRKLKVCLRAGGQVGEVAVHGYDARCKQGFQGNARGEGATAEGPQRFGGGARLSVAGHQHQPADVATAERMARGRMRKLAEGAVTAEWEMIGNPRAVPGVSLVLEEHEPHAGTYRIERATHELSRHGYSMRLKSVRTARRRPPPPPRTREAQAGSYHLKLCVYLAGTQTKVSGARWELIDAQGRVIQRGQTGADGLVCEEVPSAGQYRLRIVELPPPSAEPVAEAPPEQPPGHSPPTGTLWAQLFDERGHRPLRRCRYRIEGEGVALEGQSDADGKVRHEGVPIGDYRLALDQGSTTVSSLRGAVAEASLALVRGAASPGPARVPGEGC